LRKAKQFLQLRSDQPSASALPLPFVSLRLVQASFETLHLQAPDVQAVNYTESRATEQELQAIIKARTGGLWVLHGRFAFRAL
jgi:hypothetical protein